MSRLGLVGSLAALSWWACQDALARAQGEAGGPLEPAALEPPPRQHERPPVVMRIRFYADPDYRAGLFRWAERARAQLAFINEFVEPGFGIRFEPESFRRWHRESVGSNLEQMLAELETLDAGHGVDWVVAFVSPLPLVSASMHELGTARVLGRHFVIRGMASVSDAERVVRGLPNVPPGEREALYSRRKWHRESVVFLHEWLHTLGVPHSREPQRLTHPSYSHRARSLSPEDAGLVMAALQARLQAREGTPDWSVLRGFLERHPSPDWPAKERQELLQLLIDSGARLEPAAQDAPVWTAEERQTFDRAVALVAERKGEQAWALAQPLGAKYPAHREVQRLLCRLSHLPASQKEGEAACQRARSLAPDSPDPFVDEAQARILRGQHAEALALAEKAVEKAKLLPAGPRDVWLSIARIFGQLGALTRGEEALERGARAALPDDAKKVRDALARERAILGLPREGGAFGLSTDREPAYARRHGRLRRLIDRRKIAEARRTLAEALQEFPGAPGLEVLTCELDLRQGRHRQAEKACLRALAVMEDLPRAHYLMGHVRMAARRPSEALTAFRRARDLDPEEPAFWQTLADVYRESGRRRELAELKAEYQKTFGASLR